MPLLLHLNNALQGAEFSFLLEYVILFFLSHFLFLFLRFGYLLAGVVFAGVGYGYFSLNGIKAAEVSSFPSSFSLDVAIPNVGSFFLRKRQRVLLHLQELRVCVRS